MILTCSQCRARYLVPDQSIGPTGRRVRCAKCQNVWQQDPPEDLTGTEHAATGPEQAGPAADEPAPEEPDADGGNGITAESDQSTETEAPAPRPERAAETTSRIRQRVHTRTEKTNLPALRTRTSGRQIAGWALWVLVTLGLPAGFAAVPERVTNIWPASIQLYQLVGIEPGDARIDNNDQRPPSEFLVMELAPQPDIDQANGIVSITISGTLHNTGDRRITLPPIRGVLRDEAGTPLHNWRFQPQPQTLAPDEQRAFRTVVNDPPEGTVEFELFVDWPESVS